MAKNALVTGHDVINNSLGIIDNVALIGLHLSNGGVKWAKLFESEQLEELEQRQHNNQLNREKRLQELKSTAK